MTRRRARSTMRGQGRGVGSEGEKGSQPTLSRFRTSQPRGEKFNHFIHCHATGSAKTSIVIIILAQTEFSEMLPELSSSMVDNLIIIHIALRKGAATHTFHKAKKVLSQTY